eukprot:10208823-Lingulodinium_polyedra.AAC.1
MLEPPANNGEQARTRHGLAHPPTWAHHLGGPAVHAESQGSMRRTPGGAGGGVTHGPTAIE